VEGRQGQLARFSLKKKPKELFWHVKGLQALISAAGTPEHSGKQDFTGNLCLAREETNASLGM